MSALAKASSVTTELSKFAAEAQFGTLTPALISQCKLLILDCLGNQIGAYGNKTPTLVYEVAECGGHARPSTIVGWGSKATPMSAALVNGTLAHTLDMDDAHRDALTKTGSAITPAAMAVAESVSASGAEVIAAVVAGYEVMIRLGLAVNPSHRQRGFHSTATLGTFGAAVTAGRLMKLSPEQMISAFGIAGTQAAGLVAFINNPSMIKAFNVGRAVQSGVLAATLASKGFIGPPDILEGQEGFLKAYADSTNITVLTNALGNEYHLLECGFKPHAACRYAHGPIDAALALMSTHGFGGEDVDVIDVHVSDLAYRQSHFYEPKNVSSAQGSTPFSVASGITQRVASLTYQNINAAFQDQATWDLHRRITMHVDRHMDYMGRGCRIVVRLKTGKSHEAVVPLPRGEPENPMSTEEVQSKFWSQVVPVLGEEKAAMIKSAMDHLELQSTVAPIMMNVGAKVD